MKDKRGLPNLVIVMILTLITSILWIFVGIYGILSKKPDIPVPAPILEPINPSLETDILDKVSL